MENVSRESAAEGARRLAEPLARSLGLELVDVEWLREGQRHVLRLFVDKPGGVTLDDCAALSRFLGPALDVARFPAGVAPGGAPASPAEGAGAPEERGPKAARPAVSGGRSGAYSLEVSSPGIERRLRRADDFRRFAGRQAHVKTYEKIAAGAGEPRRSFRGTLAGCDGVRVELDLEGTRVAIPLASIAKAHLVAEEESPAAG